MPFTVPSAAELGVVLHEGEAFVYPLFQTEKVTPMQGYVRLCAGGLFSLRGKRMGVSEGPLSGEIDVVGDLASYQINFRIPVVQ